MNLPPHDDRIFVFRCPACSQSRTLKRFVRLDRLDLQTMQYRLPVVDLEIDDRVFLLSAHDVRVPDAEVDSMRIHIGFLVPTGEGETKQNGSTTLRTWR